MGRVVFEMTHWLLIDIPVCCVMGALIGVTCRERIPLQAWLAFLTSLAYFIFVVWKFGASNEWSWSHPIVSAMYQLAPFGALYLAPTFFVSLVVGKMLARRWNR